MRGLTDIQRAARFFMLIKTSYGSDKSSYVCVKREINKDINKMVTYLDKIQEWLSKVVIKNKDFERLIKQHDKAKTFFYLDPPYFGTEKYYQVGFTKEDHVRLCDLLYTTDSKWLLSYNDCEFITELYKDSIIEEVSRFYNLRAGMDDGKEYKELLISKF